MVGGKRAGPPGLNAFIPILALGLLDRFTPLVDLPPAWAWLSSDVALWVVGILLVLEVVADKIPAVDAVNDVVQTVVRPAAGGITFASGVGAQTVTVQRPDTLLDSQVWVPILIGAAMALLVHLTKAGTRAAANTVTMGTAAPVLSTAEDASAVVLTAAALFLPVLVVVVLAAVVAALWLIARCVRTGRRGGRGATMAS